MLFRSLNIPILGYFFDNHLNKAGTPYTTKREVSSDPTEIEIQTLPLLAQGSWRSMNEEADPTYHVATSLGLLCESVDTVVQSIDFPQISVVRLMSLYEWQRSSVTSLFRLLQSVNGTIDQVKRNHRAAMISL